MVPWAYPGFFQGGGPGSKNFGNFTLVSVMEKNVVLALLPVSFLTLHTAAVLSLACVLVSSSFIL